MEKLIIGATNYTPEICLDPDSSRISVKGKSYPENTAEFYSPVLNWLENYLDNAHSDSLTISFDVSYFNSSSSKVFLDLFDMFEAEADKGKTIIVNWIYDKNDKDNLEFGEEFQEDYATLKFNLIQKESEEDPFAN